jgi:hypothetical protein
MILLFVSVIDQNSMDELKEKQRHLIIQRRCHIFIFIVIEESPAQILS